MSPRAVTLSWLCFTLSVCCTGCGSGGLFSAVPISTGAHLRGGVHGGQQAVVGAHVYLLAAGTAGWQSSSVPLLATGLSDANGAYVTTDAQGGFSITGDYTCPSADAMVYILATGGNPGLSNGQVNPDIALVSALGSCGDLLANAASEFIIVNEVTTVVAAQNLSGFMADAFHLGTDGSAQQLRELRDAFDANALYLDPTTGSLLSMTPAADAVVPVSTINTLANSLAACVNSVGSAADFSGPCATEELVAAADTAGNPVNTLDVILGVLSAPTRHVGLFTNQATPAAPFQPSLASPPASLAIALTLANNTPACAPACQPLAVAAGSQGAGSFVADEYYSGGYSDNEVRTIDLSKVVNPAPAALYASNRYSFYTYDVPGFVPGSAHHLRLHFAELYWSQVNERVFDISVNGLQVLHNFDIVRAAGAANTANIQEATVIADRDGFIHIEFERAKADQPLLSGYEMY